MFVLVAQLCPTLCHPLGCSPPGSSVHGILQAEYWSGLPGPPPGDLPNLGIEPMSPALAGGFLTAGPPGDIFHQEASAPLQLSAPLNLSSLRNHASLSSPSDSEALHVLLFSLSVLSREHPLYARPGTFSHGPLPSPRAAAGIPSPV